MQKAEGMKDKYKILIITISWENALKKYVFRSKCGNINLEILIEIFSYFLFLFGTFGSIKSIISMCIVSDHTRIKGMLMHGRYLKRHMCVLLFS